MNDKTSFPASRRDRSGWSGNGFGGRGLRHPRRRDRSDLEAFCAQGASQPFGPIEGFEDLVRDAETTRPDRLRELRATMDRLEDQFSALGKEDRIVVADWIEWICLPWVRARVPLRGKGLESSWEMDYLLALLTDFDRADQILTSVDPAWRRPLRDGRDVRTTARLAVAAGWISWSHLIVDPALSGPALMVLGELLDRLDALAHGPQAGAFGEDDRAWVLAALALERRLSRHWHPGGTWVH